MQAEIKGTTMPVLEVPVQPQEQLISTHGELSWMTANMPGHIVSIDVTPGHSYLVHRHGWLCGTAGITPSIAMQQTFRGGLWGGDGFLLQRLDGGDRAWVELSGELVHYTLNAGQTLMVHPGHIGMFEASVQFQITRVPGVTNVLF